jgi:hypothetical protein
MDTVTQNQKTIQCVVLTDRGQNLLDINEHNETEQRAVQFEVLTGFGQILGHSNGHGHTEPSDCRL